MSLIIRRMTVEDVLVAHEIDVSSFTLPWPERSLRFEVTDNPAARCWAAELDGRLVGMLVLWMIVDEAHIATVATHPGYRRQGIASQLLVAALKSAHTEGARSALLEVRAGNQAAQNMYLKFGFEVVGRRERYYKDNYEDAVLMTLPRLPLEMYNGITENV
ncbi:MAG: ribosomal protein S18-alanine N-acetyltransferase [Anaerolineales bacterium]|nr:ribosomal protein S18-alanine N-acetyltransferase [Anaerolineales bacterium]